MQCNAMKKMCSRWSLPSFCSLQRWCMSGTKRDRTETSTRCAERSQFAVDHTLTALRYEVF